MERLGYWIFRLLTGLISLTPFWLLYRISDGLSFLLLHVFHYRLQVIRENIRQSFPEKTEQEAKQIIRDFYRNFSDVLLETPKGLTMSPQEMLQRYRLTNVEILDGERWGDHPRILAAGHFTNWEWGAQALSLNSSLPIVAVYKQLSNKLIENYLIRLRSRQGMLLADMGHVGRTLAQFKDKASIFVMIADQTPPGADKSHWVDFLNQATAFLPGLDKIARRSGYPVFYAWMDRVGRGKYEVTFSPLILNPGGAPEGEVSRIYARRLEDNICQSPHHWLWSHRRWKHQLPPGMTVWQTSET